MARKSSTRDESMALASHRKRPSDESIGPGEKSPSSVIDKSKTANSTWASPEACRSASGDVNSCSVRLFSDVMIRPRNFVFWHHGMNPFLACPPFCALFPYFFLKTFLD